MLKPGQTILLPKPGQATQHLWVVVVQPDLTTGETVIVNLTSQRNHSDITVILQAGDHPFVQHATVVFFADSRIVDSKMVHAALTAGTFHAHQDCTAPLLLRIQHGLFASPFTPAKVKSLVTRLLARPPA